jgi:hypothetical protein
MSIRELKNIMKQINEPNEYILVPVDLEHPLYWIWKASGVSLKSIYTKIDEFRKPTARFDVFINGQYISNTDYVIHHIDDSIQIYFKKSNFAYALDVNDIIKINGDLQIL